MQRRSNCKVTVLVLLHLSSACDTVDHKNLLDLINQRCGAAGPSRDWYYSYLSERTQTFQVVSDNSIAFVVDGEVPQGSAFGPVKCVVSTEDLPTVVEQRYVDRNL